MRIGEYEVTVTDNEKVKVGCQTVTKEQIKQVLAMMEDWRPTPKLEVGDYILVIKTNHPENRRIFLWKYGKISEDRGDSALVEFAELTQGAYEDKPSHFHQFNKLHLKKVD